MEEINQKVIAQINFPIKAETGEKAKIKEEIEKKIMENAFRFPAFVGSFSNYDF
ncbi:MAG: hypothetical protein ACI4WH_08190 [Oscillospiraceae bacterium]